MLFNSITFILFFAVVLALHYSPLSWAGKKTNLLLSSYLFYAAWNPPFVLLLALSTVVDWLVAARIGQAATQAGRKRWLLVSLTVNLGILAVFKYSGFLLENFIELGTAAGLQMQFAAPDIILPLGISFYTFQTLSYSIDVYRGNIRPWHSFRDYALYVSFFPQLVAGPIVRAGTFLPQCEQEKPFSFDGFSLGVSLLIIGLMEKVFLADSVFGPLVDTLYNHAGPLATGDAWSAAILFSMQIFCDFAGYSLCAIGVALCLGFELPYNFRSPFAAVGFSDFWRRWHVSLSSWLRDYLYISLGGNRVGRAKTLRNLMLTMLLGGLWHGAAWTFVLWGFCHGALLVIERLANGLIGRERLTGGPVRASLYWLLTFLAVAFCFAIFRADSLTQASALVASMLNFDVGSEPVLQWNLQTSIAVLACVALLFAQVLFRDGELRQTLARSNSILRGMALGVCLLLVILSGGNSDGFIYFQF